MSSKESALSGEIVEEYLVLSVDELSRLVAVDRTFIIELVEEGVLSVSAAAPSAGSADWRFSGTAIRRARTARRLQRDLEINLPGIALALELLEELQTLRRQPLQGQP